MDRPEEFPIFVAYYLERPAKGANTVTVYGLLDSESVTGAYRFMMTPGETFVMEIDSALYPRKAIDRVGSAPLTRMFQFGENDYRVANGRPTAFNYTHGLTQWKRD